MTTRNERNQTKRDAREELKRHRAEQAANMTGRERNMWSFGCFGVVALILVLPLMRCSPVSPTVKPTPTPVQRAPDVETEQARAERIAAERKRAETNAPKIKELLEGVRQLDREDVEGQLVFWNQIAALAPDNASHAKERARVQSEVDALARFREHPEEGAEVVKIIPHKGSFGTVMTIDITIRNRSLSHLKDFQIVCSNKGASGTEISVSSRTLFEMVEARSTRTFRRVEMGFIDRQTKSTNCRVMVASIA